MLVITRRPEQGVVLPEHDVTFRILSVNGTSVKVGVDAPRAIKLMREELLARSEEALRGASRAHPSAAHDLCNHLNRITLTLHLLQRQFAAGQTAEASVTLERVLSSLETLDRDWVNRHFGVAPASPPAPRPVRALVVDDDHNERELLAGLLGMNGCDCATAPDGVAALEYLAANNRPDFVLLDMWMPRCDGPSTLAGIRANPQLQGLKVFAISSTAPTDLGLPSGPAGPDAWFPKPLNPTQLWQKMKEAAGQN